MHLVKNDASIWKGFILSIWPLILSECYLKWFGKSQEHKSFSHVSALILGGKGQGPVRCGRGMILYSYLKTLPCLCVAFFCTALLIQFEQGVVLHCRNRRLWKTWVLLTSAGFHSMDLARGEQRDAGHCVLRLCALGHTSKKLVRACGRRAELNVFSVRALTHFVWLEFLMRVKLQECTHQSCRSVKLTLSLSVSLSLFSLWLNYSAEAWADNLLIQKWWLDSPRVQKEWDTWSVSTELSLLKLLK